MDVETKKAHLESQAISGGKRFPSVLKHLLYCEENYLFRFRNQKHI